MQHADAGDSLGPREGFRSGYVSLTGRPNVGKSTFLNRVLGQKVAIVTDRVQTTRNRITGIKTLDNAQIVFLDTPGIHRPLHDLGARMVREAERAVREVDVVLFMVEPVKPGADEREIMDALSRLSTPVVLVVNKVDRFKDKAALLPVLAAYQGAMNFQSVFAISAYTGDGVADVVAHLAALLPEGPMYYPADLVTDRAERFLVGEIVREKAMMATREEVPHSLAVDVRGWAEEEGRVTIHADIYVERAGQKGIIVGKGGAGIRDIGTAARRDIEAMLGARVRLELFVKVKGDWRRKPSVLNELGFDE
jgi:GTP-binding protein Era